MGQTASANSSNHPHGEQDEYVPNSGLPPIPRSRRRACGPTEDRTVGFPAACPANKATEPSIMCQPPTPARPLAADASLAMKGATFLFGDGNDHAIAQRDIDTRLDSFEDILPAIDNPEDVAANELLGPDPGDVQGVDVKHCSAEDTVAVCDGLHSPSVASDDATRCTSCMVKQIDLIN